MTWIRIKKIYKGDAFYEDRKNWIGKRFSDKYLESYPELGKGWKSGELGSAYFLGVKVEKA